LPRFLGRFKAWRDRRRAEKLSGLLRLKAPVGSSGHKEELRNRMTELGNRLLAVESQSDLEPSQSNRELSQRIRRHQELWRLLGYKD